MALENEKLLDETGWKLFHALKENARLFYSEFGKRVGLSSPAVAERIRRMEDAGIITGYHATINTARVGYPITAFIRMSIQGERCTRFNATAREIPEVLECYRVAGNDSFVMKVDGSPGEHLEDLIDPLSIHVDLTTAIMLSTPVTSRIIMPVAGY